MTSLSLFTIILIAPPPRFCLVYIWLEFYYFLLRRHLNVIKPTTSFPLNFEYKKYKSTEHVRIKKSPDMFLKGKSHEILMQILVVQHN
jgi:hypothetical protein